MFGDDLYQCPKTIVSEEYPAEYGDGFEPYYPVNDERNNALAEEYRKLADTENDVIFGGVWRNISITIWLLLLKKALNVTL